MTKTHAPKPRVTQSKMDTIVFSQSEAKKWLIPSFQRPLRINDRVRAIAEEIKATGVIPGVITLAILDGNHYIVDGQHRMEAFKISGAVNGYADVRYLYFESMAELAQEFVDLNRPIVTMKPDDVLRGLEPSRPLLSAIRSACPFVGYGHLRIHTTSPILSMSTALRTWSASYEESPSTTTPGAFQLAQDLTEESATHLIDFLKRALNAWGRDSQFARLWVALNMSLCMWLFRKLVLNGATSNYEKATHLSPALFGKCLLALSADNGPTPYVEWLIGRKLIERDRSPCYRKIREIFVRTIKRETGEKPMFPQPAWFIA